MTIAFLFALVAFLCIGLVRRMIARVSFCLSVVALFDLQGGHLQTQSP